jgi:chemotaxis protein CheD
MNPFRDIVSVRLGEYAVAKGSGRLAALGLGSCVAVMIHDAERRVGGVVHVVLPSREFSRDHSNPMKFGEEAIPYLVEEMVRAGAAVGGLQARLVGGACMFSALIPKGVPTMGDRNLAACRTALEQQGVPIIAEDVGDHHGRSAVLDVEDGTLTVRTVGKGQHRV